MTRRCTNWLTSFRNYILPLTDAPESYIFWSGVFVLSCALRRRVWIPKFSAKRGTHLLGLWNSYPYLYLMFVGPPGFRKTTTILKGEELIRQVDGLRPGPTFFTKESILEKLQQSTDASMYMIVGEFSDVFQKAGKDRAGIYEFFTSMFDGKVDLESATKSSGTVFLNKPCLSFFSATTPGWINKNMPEEVISGGFASRVIFVYEDKPRVTKTWFDDVKGDFQTLETDLLLDLIHISTKLQGEFDIEPKALEFIRNWSENPANFATKNEKLAGYMNRKFTHISKLAQIHSAATKDELVITIEDWIFAIDALTSIEPGLEQVLGGVGNNKYASDMMNIVTFINGMSAMRPSEPVTHEEILDTFKSRAEPRMIRDILQYIVEAKMVQFETTLLNGDIAHIYKPMPRKMKE